MKKAATLTEFIIVIIILGILATLVLVNYNASREKIADKEAVADLKLIRSAQQSYYLETSPNNYYPSSGSTSSIPAINSNLKLSLYGVSGRYWDYTVYSTGCAKATRRGGDGRSWYIAIDEADNEPNSGACP